MWRFLRTACSMPAGVVLLVVLASAAAVGMILPDEAARAYVYDRAWFYVLLGLLGLSLAGSMLRRIGSRSMTIWSFFTHGGILLLLGGACVTLISAERGAVVIHEGQTVDSFALARHPEERIQLGFAVRLLDFRIEHYPPVDYLVLPKNFESEIEVVEGGSAVKRHVIRVNDPLEHRGTTLYQLDYDREDLRWSVLGVSRDRGAGLVYAGFIAMSLGLAGKFYLRPARRPRGEKGGGGETS